MKVVASTAVEPVVGIGHLSTQTASRAAVKQSAAGYRAYQLPPIIINIS